ncbi:hypothetical protein EMCRGX_G031640 [Ephydatia muelleri]
MFTFSLAALLALCLASVMAAPLQPNSSASAQEDQNNETASTPTPDTLSPQVQGMSGYSASCVPGQGSCDPLLSSDAAAHDCSLPKDSGSCNNAIRRFYYNPAQNKCILFLYGGCGGNSNNFALSKECINTCVVISPH